MLNDACLSDAPDLPTRGKWARTRPLFLLPVCVVSYCHCPCPHRACSVTVKTVLGILHINLYTYMYIYIYIYIYTAIFWLRSKHERCESVVTSPRKTVFRLRLKYSAMHTAFRFHPVLGPSTLYPRLLQRRSLILDGPSICVVPRFGWSLGHGAFWRLAAPPVRNTRQIPSFLIIRCVARLLRAAGLLTYPCWLLQRQRCPFFRGLC